jgi:hypothetical protein
MKPTLYGPHIFECDTAQLYALDPDNYWTNMYFRFVWLMGACFGVDATITGETE